VQVFKAALCKHFTLKCCEVVPVLALNLGEHFDANLLAIIGEGAEQSASAAVREWGWVCYGYEPISSRKTDNGPPTHGDRWFKCHDGDFVRWPRALLVTDANHGDIANLNAITLRKWHRTFDARAVYQRATLTTVCCRESEISSGKQMVLEEERPMMMRSSVRGCRY
jgi:hypothetical protein